MSQAAGLLVDAVRFACARGEWWALFGMSTGAFILELRPSACLSLSLFAYTVGPLIGPAAKHVAPGMAAAIEAALGLCRLVAYIAWHLTSAPIYALGVAYVRLQSWMQSSRSGSRSRTSSHRASTTTFTTPSVVAEELLGTFERDSSNVDGLVGALRQRSPRRASKCSQPKASGSSTDDDSAAESDGAAGTQSQCDDETVLQSDGDSRLMIGTPHTENEVQTCPDGSVWQPCTRRRRRRTAGNADAHNPDSNATAPAVVCTPDSACATPGAGTTASADDTSVSRQGATGWAFHVQPLVSEPSSSHAAGAMTLQVGCGDGGIHAQNVQLASLQAQVSALAGEQAALRKLVAELLQALQPQRAPPKAGCDQSLHAVGLAAEPAPLHSDC